MFIVHKNNKAAARTQQFSTLRIWVFEPQGKQSQIHFYCNTTGYGELMVNVMNLHTPINNIRCLERSSHTKLLRMRARHPLYGCGSGTEL